LTNKEIIEKIRKFTKEEIRNGKSVTSFCFKSNPPKFFQSMGISVGLDQNKDIILHEETQIELGGMNKHSFSLILPIEELNIIKDGTITLLGPEINQITSSDVDFGLFTLIGIDDISEKEYSDLRTLNFLSNGIEGFSIRTVPRRFWCRISKNVLIKNFSFEFLGNAIIYLYNQKFKEIIRKIEIIFICSYPDSIDEFIKITSEISNRFREELRAKVDEWRKRIDCDYDWGCEICPYQEECYDLKQVLIEREEFEK
jgi:CO dehydrogenase/acetyl-CoA synthase beta subunit